MEKKAVYEVCRLSEPEERIAIVDDDGKVIAIYIDDDEVESPCHRSVFFDTLAQADAYRKDHIKRGKENMQDVADLIDPFFNDIDYVREHLDEVEKFPWPLNKMINNQYQIDYNRQMRIAYQKMMRVMASRRIDINGFSIRLDDIKTVKFCATICVITLTYQPDKDMNLTVEDQSISELLRVLFNSDNNHLFSDNYQPKK